ncbi:MAG: GGDEF domain-containing phosphodiesterase, partial [Candidatus Margulisbacteria bacterium]|nr:GGDEF domain-containing phosphodiesterase [Candidatus Margulisiibacteriota bacterium]
NFCFSNITTFEDISKIARKILDIISTPIVINGIKCSVTGSIGISIYPDDGNEPEILIENSDRAMYWVKGQGKNHFKIYNEEIYLESIKNKEFDDNLNNALEKNEFLLIYQPLYNFFGKIIGLEAFLRWNSSEYGLLKPEDFLERAEKTGLIVPVGYWALQQICQDIKYLQKYYKTPIPFSSNFSTYQLLQTNFIEKVEEIITSYGLSPNQLTIDITEKSIISDIKKAGQALAAAKKIGIHTALDNFGLDEASINILRKMPIDMIKIDYDFIKDIINADHSTSTIKSIINLAHNLKIENIIIERVETIAELIIIKNIGFKLFQGFVFGEPQLAHDLFPMINKKEKEISKKLQKLIKNNGQNMIV